MNTERNEGFDKFWKEWPGRDAKKAAWTSWARISPRDYPIIMAALEKQKKHKEWLKTNGKFAPSFPYASTWLNGKRWEDEVTLPEDKDAEILVEFIAKHPTLPQGVAPAIRDRAMKMFARMRWNWPLCHHRICKDESAGDEIRKAYLETA